MWGEKVRQKTPLSHPRRLSKLSLSVHVLEFHLPNIFFQISKFTFLALSLSLLSYLFHSFFFLLLLRKYFSTRVSLCIRRKIAKFQRDGERRREKELLNVEIYLSTSEFGIIFPRNLCGTSLSLSLSIALLKPREARSRRIHGGKRSNRVAFSGTRFENSVNWPNFLINFDAESKPLPSVDRRKRAVYFSPGGSNYLDWKPATCNFAHPLYVTYVHRCT